MFLQFNRKERVSWRFYSIAILTLMTFLGFTMNVQASSLNLQDGSYEITVALEGGTGKASVTSPCTMEVKDGKAFADIEWSSNHYDYMVVDGEKYLPINEDGNSTFHIPVTAFDQALSVTADTTAMSVPHEIEYTLTFHSADIKSLSSGSGSMMKVIAIIGIVALAAILILFLKKRRGKV